jgi:hypothetical protein
MKAFLAAIVAAAAIAWGAHWALRTWFPWSSAERFAAQEAVRLDPAAAVRPGF